MDARSGGVVLVKLGGSLITDKARAETFRPGVTARLARELAEVRRRTGVGLVLGHGAGSFGHTAARRHGVGGGPLADGAALGVARVQDRTAALHRSVVECLLRAGVPAFSLAPSSLAVADRGRGVRVSPVPLRLALDGGWVPTLFGDVVLDRSWGASICSTETALVAVARALVRSGYDVRGAMWAGATDGILDASGRSLARVRPSDAGRALRLSGGSAGTDVTGGMAHRLRTALILARAGIRSWIGNGRRPGALADALLGRPVPGTWVEPD